MVLFLYICTVALHLTVWSDPTSQSYELRNVGIGNYATTVTDANGCTITESTYLDVPNPVAYEAYPQDLTCYGVQNGQIRLEMLGGARPFKYTINGDTTKNSPFFASLAAGDYQVIITDAKGCSATESFTIAQPDQITIDLGDDYQISYGESVELVPEISNAVGAPIFSWTSSTSTDTITCNQPDCASIMAKPLYNALYTARVEDENGCVAIGDVQIKVDVLRGVFVPNGFTPNGDNENDKVVVFAKTKMIEKINVLRIYDRFGSLVYEMHDFAPNDMTIGWDGNFRGKEAEQGVYTFHLVARYIDGYEEPASGNVTLLR
jgi:gliding motility-associated-like protein